MANNDVGRNPKKEIEIYLKKWDNLQKYPIQEEAIRELYDSMYYERFDEKALLVKCTVLNTFYSTMIFDIASVVTHFLNVKNLKGRLKNGDITLIGELQTITDRNYYSFATKFCSHHNPNMFPIYDNFVGKMLCHFRNQDKFFSFKNKDLKDYSKFKDVYDNFRHHYDLDKYSYKEIDRYLWQVGKEIFRK